MAVVKPGVVVGHVPRKISSACSIFSYSGLFSRGWHSRITRFTSVLADSMDDDGTVVERGPRGSGSLAVSLDVLKKRNRDILVEVQQQRTGVK